jgi:hypothetical protein
MFTPILEDDTNSSTTIDADEHPTQLYVAGLRPVDANEVELAELLHTLFADMAFATVDNFDKIADAARAVDEFYRDPNGTLVVGTAGETRMSLLWPVAQPTPQVPPPTRLIGDGSGAYLVRSGDVIPLSGISARRHGFGWGYTGTGPVSLYMALVFAAAGEVAEIPPMELNDDPRSLYGWIMQQRHEDSLVVPWPEIVERVAADKPIRDAGRRRRGR